MKAAGVEALLVNQSSVEGQLLIFSKFLSSLYGAVVLNREPGIPPFNTHKYSPAWWARLRNQMGYTLLNRVAKPIPET